jgi:16S rRNA (guanine966-N2)-methyltransferase
LRAELGLRPDSICMAYGMQLGSYRQLTDALKFLAGAAQPFDIAFLDPPFGAGSGLLAQAAQRLAQGDWLRPEALIYVEYAARAGPPPVPGSFGALKAKQAGEVGYYLFAYTGQRTV